MSSSANKVTQTRAVGVNVSADSLSVVLADGRTITAPLEWYPRLKKGTPKERSRWQLIGDGVGVHWPDLDEDISIESLLQGRGSNESPASMSRWLAARRHNKT